MNRPYVSDHNGKSVTRQFIESFLEAYVSPTEDRQSIFDTITSTVGEPQELLYLQKTGNFKKNYIGRASTTLSGSNVNEYLWCLVGDVSKACRHLSRGERRIVDLKYVQDLGDHEIAVKLGAPAIKVSQTIDRILNKLAAALDGACGLV